MEEKNMSKKVKINPKTSIRIKEFLNDSGLNQQELANLIFCSPQHISRIVQGHCGLSRDTAEEIAKHYSIRVEYLLGEDDYKTEEDETNALLEEKREKYDQFFRCFVSAAEIMGYSITYEKGCKIKKNNKMCCTCSADELEVLVSGVFSRIKQDIQDFTKLVSIKNKIT